ncbi:hypothetical protein NPIL_495431 [Nephila pilipes]|uniref:Uncharacterized protein n=1 Tax=Nephila pilipes TaxID=299642 RepID=A0A8X6Q8K1_NEPPI|nr:hypothetical protein NPIL_495431 [Nephila pilipes]
MDINTNFREKKEFNFVSNYWKRSCIWSTLFSESFVAIGVLVLHRTSRLPHRVTVKMETGPFSVAGTHKPLSESRIPVSGFRKDSFPGKNDGM